MTPVEIVKIVSLFAFVVSIGIASISTMKRLLDLERKVEILEKRIDNGRND